MRPGDAAAQGLVRHQDGEELRLMLTTHEPRAGIAQGQALLVQ
eukprot:CAMPEP_0194548410 /NCGR_PEP_ID=MMETSP0253-20130528/93583_1 /TAXON_ID=2966 /ORGANISM="Noctiluca scintillans" /LENGTH=42 /DNA_ID= /DNA_START= /DNA_END= /DNA_ORIENTATION=